MRYATVLLAGIWLSCTLGWAQPQTPPAGSGQNAPAASTPNSLGPSEIVQSVAQGMLGDLDKDRDTYRRDPAKVAQLVDKYLLPHWDTDLSAKLVLGAHWRTATPDQRKRFIDAFYHSLLANYGSALVDFTADRLKVFPSNVDPSVQRATVRTEVKRENGDRVAVNYYMVKTPQGWKAWDVVIDGISYVNSYREDFGAQIEQQGLDAVIQRLQSGAKPGALAKQAEGKKG
jgi:phospholipid transport system substrate-binding protein